MKTQKTAYLWLILLVAMAGYSLGRLPSRATQPALAAAEAQISDELDQAPDAGILESFIPEIYRSVDIAAATSQATDLYLIPSDTATTNTVINIGNYNSTPVNISMKSVYDGAVTGPIYFSIPANTVTRVSADSIVAGAPVSWNNTIFYNLTNIVDMVIVTIPSSGVIVDGFIVWSGTNTTYNPDGQYPVMPLRFSTDPYSLYLPSVVN